jgi:hypothetical protein
VTDDALARQTRLLELLQDQLPAADPASLKIGYLSPLGMTVFTGFAASNGLTSQAVPVSAVITNQFIDYANDFDHRAFIAQVKQMR